MINENKKYFELIYVGGLSRIRGIKKIIQSLKFINSKHNVRLKLIDEFSDKKFKNEIESLNKWRLIKFLCQLPLPKKQLITC